MDFVLFIAAMASLIYGADFIIRESERIALHYHISPFVIGATLIGFGTSLPEMAASMMASGYGKPDMAVANVMGSVIFNITLVLGTVFLLAKNLQPQRDLFNKDSAWILFPVIVFFLMSHDGVIGRIDGIILVLMMGAYLHFLFSSDSSELTEEIDTSLTKERFGWGKTLLLLLAGFVMTIGGAHFVVESGGNIARMLGVSEWVIGLLLISLGTSLPEFVVSLVALKKGNADMSIGNIIGSNVANFAMVLGGSALISPLAVNPDSAYDLYIMAAASLSLLLIISNKLYGKAGGLFLFMLLALFLQNTLLSA